MTDKAVQRPIDERGAEVMDAELSATERASVDLVAGFLHQQQQGLEGDVEASGVVAGCWADLQDLIQTELGVAAGSVCPPL